jgi:diaminopimelate epimerase
MCGNGGRCIVAFAKYLGVIDDHTKFMAVDGLHEATVDEDVVSLKMQNVTEIKSKTNSLFMDTGSPHHVQLVAGLKDFDVVKEGAKLRYGLYGESGSNINFVQQDAAASFSIRTYERGVEDETLSCGTGVTAVALGMHSLDKTKSNTVKVNALGGKLEVFFDFKEGVYSNIYLKGAAKQVYKGEISW